jgi:hypothetical protein
MEKHIYDETNGLSYTLYGDYYLPDLELPEDEKANYGKYGMLRKTYLKEHRNSLYQSLLLQGKLNRHLNRMDKEAHERMEVLVVQMAEAQGVTEQLKAEQPMLWVQRMNGIKNRADEIITRELIFY